MPDMPNVRIVYTYDPPKDDRTLSDRRWYALDNIQRMSRKRRRLLGRFLDRTVVDVHPSSKELLEVLKDLRQFCELPGELNDMGDCSETNEATR